MKKKILQSIYKVFDSWALPFSVACRKGCSACCTRDVMATALEVEVIMDAIFLERRTKWLAEKLDSDLPLFAPSYTTNEYAHACLNGINSTTETDPNGGVCPFLEDGACAIYNVRPFSCRSFASTEICRPGASAVIAQYYLTAATAVNQVIEHLGQRYYWGNMLHIIYLFAQQNSETKDRGYPENKNRLLLAQTSCRTSKPLPGFLISEEDYPHVEPLIMQLFDTEIEGRRIEDILNNNKQ